MKIRCATVPVSDSMTRRLRDILWLSFFGLILACWAGLYAMALGAGFDLWGRPGVWAQTLAELCAGPEAGLAGFAAVFAMWAAMAAAMMLPTMVPTLTTYERLSKRLPDAAGGWGGLVAGYMIVWIGFALLAAGAQVALSRAGLLNAYGQANATALQAGLLVLAGAYQFSKSKAACQSACLSPMSYFLGRFRPGARGGVQMGLELGAYCVGCCWAIMALAFVGGVMNVAWMGLATVFMVLEKLPQIGQALRYPSGILLILSGLALWLV